LPLNQEPPKRSGILLPQLLQYFGVAMISAGVDFGVFSVLILSTAIHYSLITIIAFILGTLTNFALSNAFVFSKNGKLWHRCGKHFLSSLLGLGANLLTIIIAVEIFFFNPIPGKIIALGIGFFVNFFAIKFYAFKDKRM
jgi:putative flippase GtrA